MLIRIKTLQTLGQEKRIEISVGRIMAHHNHVASFLSQRLDRILGAYGIQLYPRLVISPKGFVL
jgi:hypothetical protein